ncbi:PLD nuclease N-terminal domain-containing protein [Glycomyces xiaoerkulensis]|uniref:PLD nuclease N-terminal domain-containing protein n=1 Tax=Glycomyces xiaoerkulensis TaxID=2038139 RepID=UPI001300080E|nr:PLD nuclease N-terminal domain-containing protein [Glycomyces xiaoerkulensis]
MVRALIFVFLVHLALLIAAVADCLGGEQAPRRLSRVWWVLIIALLPIAGAVLWFLVGRAKPEGGQAGPPGRPGGGGMGGGPKRPKGPTAPDDDPDFLRDLDRQLRDDERRED